MFKYYCFLNKNMDLSNIKKYVKENYVRDLKENPLEFFTIKKNQNPKDRYLLDLAKEKSKSVVQFYSKGSGSAFIISETEENLYLCTNLHIFGNSSYIYNFIFQDCNIKFNFKLFEKYCKENRNKDLFFYVDDIDICILMIPKKTLIFPENYQLQKVMFKYVDIEKHCETHSNLAKNTITMVAGNALNANEGELSLSFGNISDKYFKTKECEGHTQLSSEQLSYEGTSGSPMMDINGDVIGMVSCGSSEDYQCGFVPSFHILLIVTALKNANCIKEDIKLEFNFNEKECDNFIKKYQDAYPEYDFEKSISIHSEKERMLIIQSSEQIQNINAIVK